MKLARLMILTLGLSTPALAGARLELEVGGGAAGFSGVAPTFTGRLGVDLMGWFTPSVKLITTTPLTGQTVGLGVLGELRFHTPGVFQLTTGIALGLGSATLTTPYDVALNSVAPYLYGDLGFRVMLGPVFVGLAVGGAPLAQQYMGLLNVGVAVGL